MEINHDIFFRVVFLLSLIQEGGLSVTKYVHKVLVNRFVKACPGKCVVRLTDCLDMTIAVDWNVKPQTKQ